MDVTLPTGGVQLDALAVDGRLTVPPGLPEVRTTDNEQRAAGPIGGGGPTVTLERIVESSEISAYLAPCSRVVLW